MKGDRSHVPVRLHRTRRLPARVWKGRRRADAEKHFAKLSGTRQPSPGPATLTPARSKVFIGGRPAKTCATKRRQEIRDLYGRSHG
jgi:hypothetical protein